MEFYFAQLLTGLANASSLFLIASGLSIIFGVIRIVNFAHGSFYMLGAYVAYTLVTELSALGALGFWGGVLLSACAVALVGGVLEMTILRRLYRAPELFQLVATFGILLVIQDGGPRTGSARARPASTARCACSASRYRNTTSR